MSIFNILHESNQNIMEYGAAPMQPTMAFPAMTPMYMHPQRPPSSSKPSEKKDKDSDNSDLLKILAIAGLLGGGAVAAHHFIKGSNPVKDTAEDVSSNKYLKHATTHVKYGVQALNNVIDKYANHVENIPEEKIPHVVRGYSEHLRNNSAYKLLDFLGDTGTSIKNKLSDITASIIMNKNDPLRDPIRFAGQFTNDEEQ